MDLGLPDGSGIDIINFIEKQGLSTGVIVISVFGDEKHILEAISAGAMGYLLKDEEYQKIETSIVQMLNGGSPIVTVQMPPEICQFKAKNVSLHV